MSPSSTTIPPIQVELGNDLAIVLYHGPLSSKGFRDIGKLYGKHDQRYASESFCRHQFVDNALGFAYHAFAVTDQIPIGHCCVIPVPVRVNGSTMMTGKTESLFMKPEYRKRLTIHRGRRQSIACSMVQELYGFARDYGLDVIHSLGRESTAKVHVAGGAKILTVPRRLFAYFIDEDTAKKMLPQKDECQIKKVLKEQQTRYKNSTSELLNTKLHYTRIAPGQLTTEEADAFGRTEVPDHMWTIAPSPDPANWFLRSPAIRGLRVEGDNDRLTLLFSGDNSRTWLELYDWRADHARDTTADSALCRLIELGIKEEREIVCFFDGSPYNPDAATMKDAATRLGFVEIDAPRLLYVFAEEKELQTADKVVFSPYFYATF